MIAQPGTLRLRPRGGDQSMPEWSVRAVIDTGQEVDEVALLEIRDRLDAYAAALGAEPEPGRLAVQMHVEASTIRKGFEFAMRVISEAVRAQGFLAETVDVRIMTDGEFERERMRPTLPPLMGVAEVATFLGVTRQRVNQLAREHPQYFMEATRSASGPLYAEYAIRRFDARGRSSGRPKKPKEGSG